MDSDSNSVNNKRSKQREWFTAKLLTHELLLATGTPLLPLPPAQHQGHTTASSASQSWLEGAPCARRRLPVPQHWPGREAAQDMSCPCPLLASVRWTPSWSEPGKPPTPHLGICGGGIEGVRFPSPVVCGELIAPGGCVSFLFSMKLHQT